ncbi:amino acid adenylation domain-containing protein [Microbispora sp. RL4-1S]|uniref:Amino acid adenylation domain-containing protein n=1 Tax=Microbispora oryzae TaxID=2806554 RepID=A0A940WL27_9ACTN|nr:amino acid adenylation domain-containing protein [Microbispora oryzae]MBP2705857.1 amino acid adenylation domain-containing protein [Microbispora oryzae]
MVLCGQNVQLPAEPAVHAVVGSHASRHPDRIALTHGTGELWSYGRLDARANQFAHFLRLQGVGRGSIVGVCADRTPELMIAILGVLKAGAAYAPLDPTYPEDRLRLMISRLARMDLIAVTPETRELVPGGHLLDLVELGPRLDPLPVTAPEVRTRGDDLCYVVCTSGSTGTPKAVTVDHRGWYNLLNWLCTEYRLGPGSGGMVISPLGFDITQRALMLPLFAGAAVHLLPSRHFDPRLAYRLIGELGARAVHCAPSAFYLLAEHEMAGGGEVLRELDRVFLGGEPPAASRFADWARLPGNRATLANVYGVAECTDISTAHVLSDYESYLAGSVPAGRPIHNTRVLVLDDGLAEVIDGEVGEICVAGTGVGPGYLDPAPEDEARFVTVERDGVPVRLHRTGDRGYVSATSELMVVGRVDAQVKVRGMRIDLGDVETAIRRHPGVRDAAVLALPDARGQTELVAAVLPANGPIEGRGLRGDLLRALPKGMIPQRLVEVAEFPLSPHGKVDRRALARRLRHDGDGARVL